MLHLRLQSLTHAGAEHQRNTGEIRLEEGDRLLDSQAQVEVYLLEVYLVELPTSVESRLDSSVTIACRKHLRH